MSLYLLCIIYLDSDRMGEDYCNLYLNIFVEVGSNKRKIILKFSMIVPSTSKLIDMD